MKTIQPNQKFRFVPTGAVFTVGKVTDTMISWYIDEYRANKNKMKMVCMRLNRFVDGMNRGVYVIVG